MTRLDPLDMSSLPDSVVARTRQVFGDGVTPAQSVVRILEDVRRQGDVAVRQYTRMLDGVELAEFQVTEAQIKEARAQISTEVREALELAATRVTEFHQAIMRKSWVDRDLGLGELVHPWNGWVYTHRAALLPTLPRYL